VLSALKALRFEEAKALWGCSEALARKAYAQMQSADIASAASPSLLSFRGLAFEYMAPGVFTQGQYSYLEKHLAILSALYGMLRPFDAMSFARLEMRQSLKVDGASLREFWAMRLAKGIEAQTGTVLDLASKEYSEVATSRLSGRVRVVKAVFADRVGGRLIEKGAIVKMARGEAVRYLAENDVTEPEGLKGYRGLGFRYEESLSNQDSYIFTRIPKSREG